MGETIYVVRPEVLRAAERNVAEEARRRAEKRERDGFLLEYRIPRDLVVNAVVGHGVSLEDDEYWRDNARRVPGCEVRYTPKAMVGAKGQVERACRFVKTRLGNAKRFHYG